MWKKIVVSTACGAAVLGGGGIALAAAPGSSPSTAAGPTSTSTPTSTSKPTTAGKHPRAKEAALRLKQVAHASWVSKDAKTGQFVTHDAIHGSVTAVSATSISVKAADGVSQTYVITSATKVAVRADGKGKGKIADVKVGNDVLVTGTGTSAFTAVHVADLTK